MTNKLGLKNQWKLGERDLIIKHQLDREKEKRVKAVKILTSQRTPCNMM